MMPVLVALLAAGAAFWLLSRQGGASDMGAADRALSHRFDRSPDPVPSLPQILAQRPPPFTLNLRF